MSDLVLTILDTTGIQDYIFGSNKLRENIGASHLVEQASNVVLYQALRETCPLHNLENNGQTIVERPLNDGAERQAEIIYRGGGNIVALFSSIDTAKCLVREFSRRLLITAPELEITAAHLPLEQAPAIGGKDGAYNQLLEKLNRAKQQRRTSTPLLGLGVTLVCRSTGLPAVAFDKEGRAVSAAIDMKSKVVVAANQRLRDFLSDSLRISPIAYTFSDDFDDFGRSRGESSYVAVVHADGNSMGARFKKLILEFDTVEGNRACINALRALSNAVEAAGSGALQTTIKRLVRTLAYWEQQPEDTEQRQFFEGLQWRQDSVDGQIKRVLPVRPLVFGGDDVTFVCDGRLGLALASVYLEEFGRASTAESTKLRTTFQKQALQLKDDTILKPATACAGVAVVKAHYPFQRAYALSVSLCNNAKRETQKNRPGISALDWHFATTGITASLGELRSRAYTSARSNSKPGDLTMRPVALERPGLEEGWRSWRDFSKLVHTFKHEEPWRDRRNKVIALREALRAGEQDTRMFLINYNIPELPELDLGTDLQREGWGDERCGYFDAIEALDLYLPILELEAEEQP